MSPEGSIFAEFQCTSQVVLNGETPQSHPFSPVFSWLFLWTKQDLKLENKSEWRHSYRSVPETGKGRNWRWGKSSHTCLPFSWNSTSIVKSEAGACLSFEGHGVSYNTQLLCCGRKAAVDDQRADLDCYSTGRYPPTLRVGLSCPLH